MVRMRVLLCAWIALIAAAAVQAHEERTSLHLAYRLAPMLEAGRLHGLSIGMGFDLPAAGRLRLKAPQGIGAQRPSVFVSTPAVHGAVFERGHDGTWIVRGTPGAHVTMDYRVRPAFGDGIAGGSLYDGAWAGHDQFEALGNDLFAAPVGQDDTPLTFDWKAPDGWTLATTLNTFGTRAMTVEHLVQGSFVGGREVTTVQRPLHDGTLTMSAVGTHVALAPLAQAMVPVVDGLRAFWGDTRGDFTVTVLAMPAAYAGLVGIGRDGGFMGLIPADVAPRKIAWLATHEYTHAWIPVRTGRMPEGDAEPSAYWFSEGFTVFYTDRIGLRDGRATLQEFLDDFNASSVGYDMSPVRRAPNARIVHDFWSDPDVQRLPYVRGAMLAYLLDARLLDRTAGRHSLDDVMHRMRDRFDADPRLGVRENLVRSYADLGGGDIRDWLARYIDRGEQMLLPDDLFGGCLTVLREHKPGFGLVQSAAIIPGLSPQRQAACLRRLGGG